MSRLNRDAELKAAYERGKMEGGQELVAFLALHAVRYQEEHHLDGLHPTHYDLMAKYGCRMDSFKRADLEKQP